MLSIRYALIYNVIPILSDFKFLFLFYFLFSSSSPQFSLKDIWVFKKMINIKMDMNLNSYFSSVILIKSHSSF